MLCKTNLLVILILFYMNNFGAANLISLIQNCENLQFGPPLQKSAEIFSNDFDYCISSAVATRDVARKSCKTALGATATLVAFETIEEIGYINSLCRDCEGTFWTDGVYVGGSHPWRWSSSNGALGPTRWIGGSAPSSANSQSGIFAVSYINHFEIEWSVMPITQQLRYICEIHYVATPCYKANDLVVVLDSSGSVSAPDFENAKRFIAKLALAFAVVPASGFSLIVYGTDVYTHFNLNNNYTPSQLQQRIEGAVKLNGGTSTAAGIYAGVNQFYFYGRNAATNMVVVTDGHSNLQQVTEASNAARGYGIRLFSVGIGSFSMTELLAISGQNAAHVFTAKTFDDLIKILAPLSTIICP